MTGRVLVAGIGNVFLGDDGFGVEVVRRLQQRGAFAASAHVAVVDVGVRGIHLAFDLLDGCELLVLVDAAPIGRPPGTVAVLTPDLDTAPSPDTGPDGLPSPVADAHGMTPDTVISLVRNLGGRVDRVVVVACQPLAVEEQFGLSDVVAASVEPAVEAVAEVVTAQLQARRDTRCSRSG